MSSLEFLMPPERKHQLAYQNPSARVTVQRLSYDSLYRHATRLSLETTQNTLQLELQFSP